MRKLLLLLAVLLSGCATVPPAPLNVQGLERSEQVRVSDLRPPLEKEGEVFSLMITNDAYAIYRVAEAATAPSSVRLLQHRAHETLRAKSDRLELKVHHFVVYRNMQSQLRRGAVAAGLGGLVGALAASANNNWVRDPSGAISTVVDRTTFDALGATEFKRAYYTEEENPGRGSVHVVYIDTEVDGKRVLTRTMAPLNVPGSDNPLSVALEAAVRFHLAQH